jgi:hypothetical protein
MSEINVVSRTQQIIVDPSSGSVAIINAGPIGPTGSAGVISWGAARTIETTAALNYTTVAADAGKVKKLTNANPTVTLSAGGLTAGQSVDFVCIAGRTTFVLESGAAWDVPPTPGSKARAIGSFVTAIKMTATAWALRGDLST